MMKKLVNIITAFPIKWRLTVWSSTLLCVLFLFYNAAQYVVLHKWTMNQEMDAVSKSMDEIQVYFADKATVDVEQSRSFLEKVNQHNQILRILDAGGKPMLTINEDLPDQWVPPVPVSTRQMKHIWHFQDHLLALRAPLTIGTFTGTIELVRNLETFEKMNNVIILVMAVGGLFAVAISGIGGLLLAVQLVKPIAALTETIRRIKQKGLQERVQFTDNKDELSRLSQTFNEMMDQLEAAFQQQKQFVEDASHELRTPVAIIEGHLSMLNRWGRHDPSVLQESLTASLQEIHRLRDLTQELLSLSRAESISESYTAEHIDPSFAVKRIVEDFSLLYPEFSFEVDLSGLIGREITISAHHFKQIIMIILDNAVKYSGEQRKVTITGMAAPSSSAQLTIADYGIGISKAELPFVFDRFYRVDKARSRKMGGSGLGLAIAKRLVETNRGTITIASEEKEGTAVTVTIPVAEPGSQSENMHL